MQKSNTHHHQPPYYWTTTTTTTTTTTPQQQQPHHHHMDPNAYFSGCDVDGDVSQGSHQFSSDHTLPNNSFSSNGSPNSLHSFQPEPLYHSPDNDDDTTYTSHLNMDRHLELTMRELGAIIGIGIDQDFVDDSSSNLGDAGCDTYNIIPADEECSIMEEIIARGDLKEALLACAKAVAQNNTPVAEKLISMLRPFVSVSGDPSQRLAAYMLEGLVARLYASGTSIYKSLKCKEPTGGELFSYMMLLYEACPYFKFGYLSANGAIAEATKNEDTIHIIDYQISQGGQWVTLIQALADRPGGPPKLRITGIDDSRNAFARGGGLNIVGQRLAKLAESCKVPFEFYGVPVSVSDIEIQHLTVQPGEALVVNCALVLHHLPDETVHPQNHRDRVIRLIKSLSPKVVTLVEQESDVNTTNFFPRFQEAFSYYSAMFDSIDATLPRDHKERINVEQHCLAGEIVNVLACEGTEREERHELLGMWRSRFAKAGFTPFPLSTYVNATIKTLLENYCDKYRLEERDGALFLGWMNRDLVSSCAWK